MELIRTFLAVPPDDALRERLAALFPAVAAADDLERNCAPVLNKVVGAGPARDRGPEGRATSLVENGSRRGLTPANRAHGALPQPGASRAGAARDSGGVRWADLAGLHITLVFLGATRTAQVTMLYERVHAVARALSVFAYTLGGPLLFPDARRPRVLALEPPDPAGFVAWQAPLVQACVECGFEAERRAYRPHLSLARLGRSPPDRPFAPLAPLAAALAGMANEIVLYQSRAGRYHPLFRLACGGAERAA